MTDEEILSKLCGPLLLLFISSLFFNCMQCTALKHSPSEYEYNQLEQRALYEEGCAIEDPNSSGILFYHELEDLYKGEHHE